MERHDEYPTVSAFLPWNSPYREDRAMSDFEQLPQQKIDICLLCPLHADSCDKCDGERNLSAGIGRPKSYVDTELLREMLRLRRTNKEMCDALGVKLTTLQIAKRKIKEDIE